MSLGRGFDIPTGETNVTTRSTKAAICGFGIAFASLALMAIPSAAAGPVLTPPLSPRVEEPCDDFDKLACDPNAGQIVCDGSTWSLSVTPVGVQHIGAPCLPDQINRQFATSDDGYLIYCPGTTGVWGLYQP